MELSRPEYWSGQPFPSPGDIPDPGTESESAVLQVDSLPAEPQGSPCIVKAMVFPVVMYKCDTWTIKNIENGRIDAFKLQCW